MVEIDPEHDSSAQRYRGSDLVPWHIWSMVTSQIGGSAYDEQETDD